MLTPLGENNMDEIEEYQAGEIVEPLEQQTITFYDKPVVVVRLPNGEPGAVLRYLCENLGLALTGQVSRVKRKSALASGLHYVRIETAGGPQVLAVLTLRVVPGWLFGIDINRVKPEIRPEIERYQAECVDVLYQWASTPHSSAPPELVSEQPIEKPVAPEKGANLEEWRTYYQRMIEFTDWQLSIETWRGGVEERLESIEALIPEILERLPETTITPAHQNMVKYYVSQIHKATDKPYATIYSALYTAFQVPTYTSLREDEWDKIEQWLKKQLTKVRVNEQPEQGKLL